MERRESGEEKGLVYSTSKSVQVLNIFTYSLTGGVKKAVY
jgi:hypothetical protein